MVVSLMGAPATTKEMHRTRAAPLASQRPRADHPGEWHVRVPDARAASAAWSALWLRCVTWVGRASWRPERVVETGQAVDHEALPDQQHDGAHAHGELARLAPECQPYPPRPLAPPPETPAPTS